MSKTWIMDVPLFGSNGPTPTVSPELAGVWVVTFVAVAQVQAGDDYTVDDGVNTPVNYTIGSGLDVDTDGLVTDEDVRDAALAVLQTDITAELLEITAVATSTNQITITMLNPVAGTVSESVTDAGFTVTGGEPDPAQTWSFKIAGIRSGDSTTTAAGTAGTDTHGPLVASAANRIVVTWTDGSNWAAAGITHAQIWCTAGPGAVEGLVGTVALGVETFTYTGQAPTVAIGSIPATNTTGIGDPIDVAHFRDLHVCAYGTATATLKLQGSLDGVLWVDEIASMTIPGTAATAVTEAYTQMRTNMTALTSATSPGVVVTGHME